MNMLKCQQNLSMRKNYIIDYIVRRQFSESKWVTVLPPEQYQNELPCILDYCYSMNK